MADRQDPWEPEEDQPYSRDPRRNQPSPERPWQPPPDFRRFPLRPPASASPAFVFKRALRQNANAVCGGLVLVFLIGPVIVEVLGLFRWIIPGFDAALRGLTTIPIGLLNMSIATLSLFLPALLIARWLNMPTRVAFPLGRAKARMIVPGVFCCLGMSVVGVYISALLRVFFANAIGATPISPDFSPPAYGLAETMIFMIAISVIPAVFEEVLCRGVVMQSLRRFGDGFALVVSSLLFAMLHRNFVQGPNALLVGLVLGYFTLRTGSLIPAIVMHFVNNFMAAGISVFAMYLPARYASMLNFAVLPTYLALGAFGVVLMMALNHGFTPLHQKPGENDFGNGRKYALFFFAPLGIVFSLITLVLTVRHFDWI